MTHGIVNEDLLKKVDNRFLLTVAASKRSRQLQEGAHSLVEDSGQPPVLNALEEILQDKIGIRVVDAPIEVVSPVGRRFVQSVALKEDAPKARAAEPAAKSKKKEEKEDAESKKKQTAKSKKKKSVVA